MNIAYDLLQAFNALADVVKYVLNTPSFIMENVTYGDFLIAIIIFAIMFWCFWDLLRK